MLQTDYIIGSPLNHQDPFIQRHGSQLTANELPPFRQPFTSRRGIRLAYSFPEPARGWEMARYRLKYCLKGPLSPKLPTYLRLPKRRRKKRGRIDESKNVQTTPPAPTASAVGPCPTVIRIVGRPGTGSLPTTIAPPDIGWLLVLGLTAL